LSRRPNGTEEAEDVMLSDQLRQLLTAYVDGELTNRQRRAVERLLRRSPEARALLHKLQEDAQRLHALPRQHLGDEFTARIVRAVRQRQAQQRQRDLDRQGTWPLYAALAAAAAVLLAVGLSSYFFFAQSMRPISPGDLSANNTRSGPELPAGPTADPQEGGKTENDPTNPDPHPAPADPGKKPASPERLGPPVVVSNDKPREPGNSPEVLGQEMPLPNMEMFKPHVVKPPFQLLEDVRKIQAKVLRQQFGSESALRIELNCIDTAKAFHRLQAALKSAGVTLVIDANAQNRLDKSRLRSNHAILVEELSADELVRLLERVGSDDRKAAEAKPKDGQFTKMVVTRLSDDDRKELSQVLRVDANLLQPGLGKGKETERLALAVTYNPELGRPRPNSPEVKRYLENRKPAQAGAVQVLLVLREPLR
jgi:hypothetical protein